MTRLAPPARAARRDSVPVFVAPNGTAFLREPSPAPAGPCPAGPAMRALGRSGHTGQRGREHGDPAPPGPGSSRDGPAPL